MQPGLSASERVFALIDAEPEVVQVDRQPVRSLQGDIRFLDVDFQYSDKSPVLSCFNLHVQPGETGALVGHTGAGESSIAKLIARFYEIQGGQILIDGRDIRSFDLHSYRGRLGIVSQPPFLFSGTVAENICYACPSDATKAEIAALAGQTRIGGAAAVAVDTMAACAYLVDNRFAGFGVALGPGGCGLASGGAGSESILVRPDRPLAKQIHGPWRLRRLAEQRRPHALGDHAIGRKRDDEHEQGRPHFDLEAVCLLQASARRTLKPVIWVNSPEVRRRDGPSWKRRAAPAPRNYGG